jgi:formylglycine-generating enzyme
MRWALVVWLALSACVLAQAETKTLVDPGGKCLILEGGADTSFLEARGVPPYPGAVAYRINLAASAEASGEAMPAEQIAQAEELMRQVVFETSDPLPAVREWVVRHFVGWQVKAIEERDGVRGFEASTADGLANLMAFDYQRDGLRYIVLIDMGGALAALAGEPPPAEQLPLGLSRDLASYAVGLPDDPTLAPAGAVVSERDGSVLVPIDLYGAPPLAYGGPPDAPAGALLSERPRFHAHLEAYAIGLCEVTNAQYARFVAATGHRAPRTWPEGAVPAGLEGHPVVGVSWNDANAYCEWAGLRLPTELEWERAARGPAGSAYPWGDEWDPSLCRNATDRGDATTARVGSYPGGRSACGLFDMAGNVAEWCSDWAGYTNAGSAVEVASGEVAGLPEVIRGGSWADGEPATAMRCYAREFAARARARDDIGFRVARDWPRRPLVVRPTAPPAPNAIEGGHVAEP